MLHRQRSWLGLCVLLALTAATVVRAADEQTPASLWADFNHYVLIARPDLAQAAGDALLHKVDDAALLDVVEKGVTDYPNYETTLIRALSFPSVADVAKQLTNRIQAARIARSREAARIAADIKLLAEGDRQRENATARLPGAGGQYAVPALLNVLLDDNQARLHPYVLDAMIALGEPAVTPLSVALPGLEPVTQGLIAHVLANIGYPRALPAMQEVIENKDTDAAARRIVKTAFDQLAASSRVDGQATAAALYLRLAQDMYAKATHDSRELPNLDTTNNTGLVWSYSPAGGLQYLPVPAEIFGDVQAMSAAVRALRLEPTLEPALSIWLTANLRRANRLPEGKKDPTYAATMLPPIFYARAAGPMRLHDVLLRALEDSDTRLALDAIGALSATAGTDALVNRKGVAQPLVSALYYPDRRVRWAAAFAFCAARPKTPFPGSPRVVPVLAEAVRQSDRRYALVIGSNQDTTNKIIGALTSQNYQAFGGTNLTQAVDALADAPGVDLLVTNLDADGVKSLANQTISNYKLAGTPILVLTTPGNQVLLNERFGTAGRVRSSLWSADPAALNSALQQAAAYYAGQDFDAKEALEASTKALNLLAAIAIGAGDVFNVADAQPTLKTALHDSRAEIPVLAAEVLAKINSPDAQQAIADAALDSTRPEPVRISLLNAASESAVMFGNHLNPQQLGGVLQIVRTGTGDLAVAAARLHGALTLPAKDVVDMIIK